MRGWRWSTVAIRQHRLQPCTGSCQHAVRKNRHLWMLCVDGSHSAPCTSQFAAKLLAVYNASLASRASSGQLGLAPIADGRRRVSHVRAVAPQRCTSDGRARAPAHRCRRWVRRLEQHLLCLAPGVRVRPVWRGSTSTAHGSVGVQGMGHRKLVQVSVCTVSSACSESLNSHHAGWRHPTRPATLKTRCLLAFCDDMRWLGSC